jgi:hypothetical protein
MENDKIKKSYNKVKKCYFAEVDRKVSDVKYYLTEEAKEFLNSTDNYVEVREQDISFVNEEPDIRYIRVNNKYKLNDYKLYKRETFINAIKSNVKECKSEYDGKFYDLFCLKW